MNHKIDLPGIGNARNLTKLKCRAYPNTLRTIKKYDKQTILLYKTDDSLNYILKLSSLFILQSC